MSFHLMASRERLGGDNTLEKVHALVDWERVGVKLGEGLADYKKPIKPFRWQGLREVAALQSFVAQVNGTG